MIDYWTQYRINKKGAECFRSADYQATVDRLHELQAKRPGVYTMQARACRLDCYGCAIRDWKDRPQWGPWEDAPYVV